MDLNIDVLSNVALYLTEKDLFHLYIGGSKTLRKSLMEMKNDLMVLKLTPEASIDYYMNIKNIRESLKNKSISINLTLTHRENAVYGPIYLRSNEIVYLHCLSNIQEVHLENYMHVTNVQSLCNVPTVKIRNCPSIVDVSSLGNVRSLSLEKCEGIHDFSVLSNVKELSLILMSQVRDSDLLYFKNIEKLTLSHMCIRSVSCLETNTNLVILHCSEVNDYHTLASVSNLSLGLSDRPAYDFFF